MRSKFDKVKVAESRTVYDKHGRRVVVDTLEFTDGSGCGAYVIGFV